MQLDPIDQFIQKECRLVKDQPILIGVSGGPDSLCLMDLLHHLEYSLVVAYLDHQLRPEASQEGQIVAGMAAKRGIPVVLESYDVAAYARQYSLTIEEAARIVRYHFLFDQARRLGAQAVGVGHTADDQVETVLMHLLRGAGLAGLKGMRPLAILPEWDGSIPLVRPLLRLWRKDTVAYCAEHHLQPIYDPSNQDPTYFRNRLRLETIPFLETHNPQFRQAMARMAESLSGDWETLEGVYAEAWQRCLETQGAGYRGLNRSRVLSLGAGIRRGLVRKAILELRPSLRDVDFEAVERALAFIQQPPASGRADFIDRIDLAFEAGRVYFIDHDRELPVDAKPQLLSADPLPLPVPGCLALGNGWQITAEFVAQLPAGYDQPEMDSDVWLDGERLSFPLQVRSRQAGDRFAPFGLGGKSQKLSDFFINVKLPYRYRPLWPLICSREQIIWVVGIRPADEPKIRPSSHLFVHLHLERQIDQD